MRFFSDNAATVHPRVMAAMADANHLDTAYDGDGLSRSLDARLSDLFGTDVAALWVPTGTRGQLPRARRAVSAAWRGDLPPRRAYPER